MRSLIVGKESHVFLLIEFVISTMTAEIGRTSPRKAVKRMSARKAMEGVTIFVLTRLEDSSATAGQGSNGLETAPVLIWMSAKFLDCVLKHVKTSLALTSVAV